MRKFQVFRYLARWKYIIVLITIIGSALIYWYGNKNQTYTATAVMEYTNASAVDGLNPDGSGIDSTEINSAAVITDVIHDLGLSTNVESIRSKCSIREIIPPEEDEKRENALKLGDEYSYFPTNYQVSYTVGSDKNKDYARDVLDSLLTNYFSLYCRKYVDYAIFPNNATNVTTEQYDYVDCVEMLEKTAKEIIYYLESRAENYPNFRSADTGYSFSDLKEAYASIQDYAIPDTYAFILNNRLVNDKELLLKRYENNRSQYIYEIENCKAHLEEARTIIRQFGDKTLEENDFNYSFGSGNGSNQGLIINNVEDNYGSNEKREKAETTYDKLINQLVELQDRQINLETSLDSCEEILQTFSDPSILDDRDSDLARRATEEIKKIAENMNELYAATIPTIAEFKENNGADNQALRTSISVKEKYNMNIYLALALIFFFTFGCVGAVVLGRIGDFIEYFMYTDRKTGLPNRNRCDIMIEQYEEKLLTENFVCLVCKLELRLFSSPNFTRRDGDILLHQFGGFIKRIEEDGLFAGYNNDGMFLLFLENCTHSKAYAYAERLREMAEHYNTEAVFPVMFEVGIAESTAENLYSIRELLRRAIRSLGPMKQEPDNADGNVK